MMLHTPINRPFQTTCVALLLLFVGLNGFAQVTAEKQSALDQAGIIFVGTVKETGAAVVSKKATRQTAIVYVEELIRPTASPLARYNKQNITVRLLESGNLKTGSRAVFYAELGSAGTGLTVIELAHRPVEGSMVAARANVERMIAAMDDRKLKARVDASSIIVRGRVTAIREISDTYSDSAPRSEHDPNWCEALVQVQEAIKGVDASKETITVMYSGSNDIAWYGSPKFALGDEGVFILGIDDASADYAQVIQRADGVAGMIVSKDNLLPVNETSRIKRLFTEKQ